MNHDRRILDTGVALIAALALLAPVAARAATYGYRDEAGHFHVVSDERQIPERYRAGAVHADEPAPAKRAAAPGAQQGAKDVGGRAESTPAASNPEPEGSGAGAAGTQPAAQPIVINSTDTSSPHVVTEVVFEGSVPQKMLVDTGASITTISVETARRLGFSASRPLAYALMSTASGEALMPITRVKSVDASGARVRDLAVVVNPYMTGAGLLGVDFLGEFNYTFDSGTQSLTLSPLDPNPRPGVYGGHPEAWWKSRAASLRGHLASARKVRDWVDDELNGRNSHLKTLIPSSSPWSARDIIAFHDGSVRFWEQELRRLEVAASSAGLRTGLR
ncbi:MAG: retropepsin-like aspartic protease [bacterium]